MDPSGKTITFHTDSPVRHPSEFEHTHLSVVQQQWECIIQESLSTIQGPMSMAHITLTINMRRLPSALNNHNNSDHNNYLLHEDEASLREMISRVRYLKIYKVFDPEVVRDGQRVHHRQPSPQQQQQQQQQQGIDNDPILLMTLAVNGQSLLQEGGVYFDIDASEVQYGDRYIFEMSFCIDPWDGYGGQPLFGFDHITPLYPTVWHSNPSSYHSSPPPPIFSYEKHTTPTTFPWMQHLLFDMITFPPVPDVQLIRRFTSEELESMATNPSSSFSTTDNNNNNNNINVHGLPILAHSAILTSGTGVLDQKLVSHFRSDRFPKQIYFTHCPSAAVQALIVYRYTGQLPSLEMIESKSRNSTICSDYESDDEENSGCGGGSMMEDHCFYTLESLMHVAQTFQVPELMNHCIELILLKCCRGGDATAGGGEQVFNNKQAIDEKDSSRWWWFSNIPTNRPNFFSTTTTTTTTSMMVMSMGVLDRLCWILFQWGFKFLDLEKVLIEILVNDHLPILGQREFMKWLEDRYGGCQSFQEIMIKIMQMMAVVG